MKKILATDQEIATLRVLIHRAVLHDGMDVAEAAVMWGHKLKVAEAAGDEPPPLDKIGAIDVVR